MELIIWPSIVIRPNFGFTLESSEKWLPTAFFATRDNVRFPSETILILPRRNPAPPPSGKNFASDLLKPDCPIRNGECAPRSKNSIYPSSIVNSASCTRTGTVVCPVMDNFLIRTFVVPVFLILYLEESLSEIDELGPAPVAGKPIETAAEYASSDGVFVAQFFAAR
ncbi:hypothetical protein BVI1335_1650016 [Burkholderia vietnamiensis]|nr:hypothetical protein BVI1335_1650016 [Burkholderia vietnamiensis]